MDVTPLPLDRVLKTQFQWENGTQPKLKRKAKTEIKDFTIKNTQKHFHSFLEGGGLLPHLLSNTPLLNYTSNCTPVSRSSIDVLTHNLSRKEPKAPLSTRNDAHEKQTQIQTSFFFSLPPQWDEAKQMFACRLHSEPDSCRPVLIEC